VRRGIWALSLALSATAEAQVTAPGTPAGRCTFEYEGRDSTRVTAVKLPSGQYNSYLGNGVVAHCRAQSIDVISDSAEYFGDYRLLHLIGHVHYTEPRLAVDAQTISYFMTEERLLAEGAVNTKLVSGTTIVGPRQEYFRAVPPIRTTARLVAPGRPTIDIAAHDSTGAPAPPTRVVANTVVTEADSLVYAAGDVVITRPDVMATGDSVYLDSGREYARLMRKPKIDSRGDRPFTLTGNVIDMFSEKRALSRVLTMGQGKAVSQDATLTADTLDFRLATGRVQRVYGWGPGRARAVNKTYDAVADSMDVMMPGQRLRQVHAIRLAFAQSLPDTLRLHTKEKDWVRGDSIFTYFDSSAAALADTSHSPYPTRMIARGNARSYYQLAPRDTTALKPAINYVRGRDLTVAFADRQVHTVTVTDSATGVYLEPDPPKAKTKKDSTKTTSKDATKSSSTAERPPLPSKP